MGDAGRAPDGAVLRRDPDRGRGVVRAQGANASAAAPRPRPRRGDPRARLVPGHGRDRPGDRGPHSHLVGGDVMSHSMDADGHDLDERELIYDWNALEKLA